MNIIVVGGGSIGKRHIRNLLSFDAVAKVVVVDPSDLICQNIVNEFGIATFLTLESALEKEKYDVAFVCSPSYLHVSHSVVLAKKKIHLFIEKPVSLSQDEARMLLPVLKLHEVHVMVGCNLRFHPGVVQLLSGLERGLIGRPIYARAHFAHYLPNWRPGQDYRTTYSAEKNQGGGILLDDIHEPDYLCWLMGEVTAVSSSLENSGELKIDSEDIAEYTLWHKSGTYSQIHADYLRRDKSRGCELIGTNGTLVWKSVGKNPEIVTVDCFNADTDQWINLFTEESYAPNQQYIDEIEYFLDCIKRGQAPMNGASEALELIGVLDAVKQASHLGRVKLASPIV